MKLSRLVSVLVALKFRILDSRFDPLDFDFLNYALHAERLTGGVNGGDPSANGCPSDGNSGDIICAYKDA